MTTRKHPGGRPKTRPEWQGVHLRLARNLYNQLKQWSNTSGVPLNTLIERAVQAALITQKGELQ